MKPTNKGEDYSWFRVHYKSISQSARLLFVGVIKNFKRVSWHSRKGLTFEYIQVLGVITFMTLFCFAIFSIFSSI